MLFLPYLQAIETKVGKEIEVDSPSKNYMYFETFRKNGFLYNLGDCCYMKPEAFDFSVKPAKPNKIKPDKKVCVYLELNLFLM